MKKILFSVLLFGLLLSRISFADENENRIITELKTWKYSVGDCAYLMKAKEFYYGVGMEKDLLSCIF